MRPAAAGASSAERLRQPAAGAARRRRPRAADRLRQPRQPAAGADDGPRPRGGGAARAWREPWTPRAPAAHREPVPRRRRWPLRPPARRRCSARRCCACWSIRSRCPTRSTAVSLLFVVRADAGRGADARPAAGAPHHRRADGDRAPRSGARHRRVRRLAAHRPAGRGRAAGACRCRCWSAPDCWRGRWSTCSAPISGYARDGLLTVRVDAQAAGYEPARQAEAFEALLDARPRHPRRPRRVLLGQRPVRRLGQRRRDHRRGLHPPKATAIAGRATTRSVPATSRRSASRCIAGREITAQDRAGGARCASSTRPSPDASLPDAHPIGLHVTQRYADVIAHLPGRRRGAGLAPEPPARAHRAPVLHARHASRPRASAA